MRVMGFDVGTKKTGVAIGQMITKTATPLKKIYSKQGQFDWASLDRLVHIWSPKSFIVGIPLDMKGYNMTVTPLARRYLMDLSKHYPTIPVYEADERLTTKTAKQTIFDCYGYRGLKSKDVDGLAACLLLEQWMSQQ